MQPKNPVSLAIDALEFNNFGEYEVKEILTDDELEIITGGEKKDTINVGCSINIFCAAPPPNSSCAEDDDSNI